MLLAAANSAHDKDVYLPPVMAEFGPNWGITKGLNSIECQFRDNNTIVEVGAGIKLNSSIFCKVLKSCNCLYRFM